MRKETKLERVYTEFENNYKNKTEDEINKNITDLQKGLDGKEIKLKQLESEKEILLQEKDTDVKRLEQLEDFIEKLEKNISESKKKLENLKGYSKNRIQIEKIKDYKSSLENKVKSEISKNKTNEKMLEEALKDRKKVTQRYEELRKKSKDEKYTSTLDNIEYNELQNNLKEADKDMKSFDEKIDELDKEIKRTKDRIEDLNSKISKCNLAWKTLFTNKDWDEIQKRAIEENTRYTKQKSKIRSNQEIYEGTPIDEDIKSEEEIDIFNITSTGNNHKDRIGEENYNSENVEEKSSLFEKIKKGFKNLAYKLKGQEEKKALVPKKESKIRNLFNNILNKFKKDNISQTKEENIQDDINQENEPKVQNTTARDEFLEGLRRYVDIEYKKEVKSQKIEQSNTKYTTKAQSNNQEELYR